MMVCTDDMTLSFVKKSRRKELSYFLGSIFVVIIFNLTYPLININDQTVIKYHDHPLETKKEIQPPPELLLSVPFYVYEELIWENATIGSRLVSDHARNYSGMNRPIFKHSDDYLFLEASLKHPQHTHNMDEAKLFFVPVLFNYLDMESISKGEPLCWNSMCRNELLHYSSQVLQKSRAFQQYPERHIHVRSHFGMLYDWWKKKQQGNKGYNEFMTLSAQMHTISFEGRDYITNRNPDRLVLPTYYVGSGCKQVDEKTHDVAMIASLHENRPWFQDRRNICLWLKNSSSITTSICGYGDKCPALAKSKFGIHARGDTWGSQRIMDTILSGSVPILTSLEQYEIQGSWIDWKQLSYYLPVHTYTSLYTEYRTKTSFHPNTTKEKFLSGLEKIVEDKEGYDRRHRAILENMKLFDYTTLYPFDVYMYLVQAHLFPESRHSKSRWSALLLPPVLFDQ